LKKQGETPENQDTNGEDGAHGDQEVAMANADGEVQQTKDPADDQDGEKPQDGSEEQQGDEQAGDQNMMNGQQGMNFQEGQDFNQMQMMMAMQNGMNPNSFGGFNMMGTSSTLYFFFTSKSNSSRHARNGHGPHDDAEYVHERRVQRHGHGRSQWRK
jgi:hypothetical protein